MKAFNKKKKPKHFTQKRNKLWKISKIITNYYGKIFDRTEIINIKNTKDYLCGICIVFYKELNNDRLKPMLWLNIRNIGNETTVDNLDFMHDFIQNKIKKIIGPNRLYSTQKVPDNY